MKITLKWKNPWLRVALYALVIAALFLVIGGGVRFVYQGY